MSQAGWKNLLGFVALFVAALFTIHHTFSAGPNPELPVVLLAALFLEFKAPRHGLFGFAPATFPLYIHLTLSPSGSPGLATVCALVAIGLRSFTVKRDFPSWVAWEFLIDALPTVASIGLLKLLNGAGPLWSGVSILALVVAALCHLLLRPILQSAWLGELPEPKQKSWQRDMVNATTLLTLVSFLAVPFGLLARAEPRAGFLLPIGLFLLATAVAPLLDPARNPVLLFGQTAGAPPQDDARLKKETGADATAIDLKKEDFSFLRQFADSLPDSPYPSGVWDELVWMARRLVSVDSVVVFHYEDGLLRAWPEYKTPFKEQLKKAEEEGLEEPVVRRALNNRRVDFLRKTDVEDGRIFVEEQSAVAVPIHERGALYLGRAEAKPFSESELNRLSVLGQQAHLALLAAEFCEEMERQRESGKEAKERAEFLLAGISSLVGVMKELLSTQSVEELLDKAGARLGRLVAHDYWAIVAGSPGSWPPSFCLEGPPSKPRTDRDAILRIAELAMQRGVVLCENNMKESNLPQPSRGGRSVLCAPLFAAGETVGAILLVSAGSEAFKERERDLMAVFGYLLGSHFYALLEHTGGAGNAEELEQLQKQLVQSSKMAAIGQSAAGVAHELNTPLGAVMLAIEGAIKTLNTNPERSEKRLQRALVSSAQLKGIIQKLLAFSREGTARETETDLNQAVKDTVELLGNQIALDNIELVCHLGETDPVMANPNEVQQIVVNLLTNARDAVLSRSNGSREIRITTGNHPKAVELAVEDSGTGMDEKTQARVFEPFFTTKEEGKGTGLGLSVTRELIEKHGGAIRVQSTPGEGSRFVLRFPKARP